MRGSFSDLSAKPTKTDKTSTLYHFGEEFHVELPTAVPGQDVNITFPDGCTDSYSYTEYVAKFPKTLSKEIKMSFVVEKQTANNRENAAVVAKLAAKGRKATISIDAVTWTSPAYATLSVYNDSGDTENTQSVYVSLNAADLKNLQDAVYKARVDLDKAENKNRITNPDIF